jgi:SAM-dependent methyltransferase
MDFSESSEASARQAPRSPVIAAARVIIGNRRQTLRQWRRRTQRLRAYSPSKGWASPLRLARHSLRAAVRERAHYAGSRLLDVGCGQQPYRDLFPNVRRYIGLDTPGNGSAEVYGDALTLPFRGGVFDTVLCNQVLEHVPEPRVLLSEIVRVLKPAGILLLTAPQTWGLHREPDDFYRYTKYGLRYLAEAAGLRVVDITPTCGLWATVAQRIADTVVYTYAAGRSRWLVETLAVLLTPLLLAGDLADRVVGKRGDTLDYVIVAAKGRL